MILRIVTLSMAGLLCASQSVHAEGDKCACQYRQPWQDCRKLEYQVGSTRTTCSKTAAKLAKTTPIRFVVGKKTYKNESEARLALAKKTEAAVKDFARQSCARSVKRRRWADEAWRVRKRLQRPRHSSKRRSTQYPSRTRSVIKSASVPVRLRNLQMRRKQMSCSALREWRQRVRCVTVPTWLGHSFALQWRHWRSSTVKLLADVKSMIHTPGDCDGRREFFVLCLRPLWRVTEFNF